MPSGHLSENDLKYCFCLLNHNLGEKTVNQYRFDDKFSQKVQDFFEGQKEGQKDLSSKNADRALLFDASKPNTHCELEKEETSLSTNLTDKIFDYKNLFNC